MNELLQQTTRATREFRTSKISIALAYLRMSKPKHLVVSLFKTAAPG